MAPTYQVQLGDRKIIATEPAVQTRDFGSGPQTFERKTMVKHLLSDGSEVFGCVITPDCDYMATTIGSVLAHTRVHVIPLRDQADLRTMTVAEFIKLARDYDPGAKKVSQTELEQWRKRALEAEAHLKALRDAIRGVG